MPGARSPVHPYIPNSAPEIKEAMLREIGAADVDELYGVDPASACASGARSTLGRRSRSEVELRRHLEGDARAQHAAAGRR